MVLYIFGTFERETNLFLNYVVPEISICLLISDSTQFLFVIYVINFLGITRLLLVLEHFFFRNYNAFNALRHELYHRISKAVQIKGIL